MVRRDNSHLDVKLEMRRQVCRLLDKPARVLDCCAGRGVIWRRLKMELEIGTYLPIDVEPKMAGTLRMDSREVLGILDLTQFNVIDVDTYGEPWEQWLIICRRLKRRTAVFLTHGHISPRGAENTSMVARKCMGVPEDWNIPKSGRIAKVAARYCLARGCESARILEGRRWMSRRVDYYGFMITGKK